MIHIPAKSVKVERCHELATDQKTYVDDIHVVGRSLGTYCQRTKESNRNVLPRTRDS